MAIFLLCFKIPKLDFFKGSSVTTIVKIIKPLIKTNRFFMNLKEMAKTFSTNFIIMSINEVGFFAAIAIISHHLTKDYFGNFQSFIASMSFFGALCIIGFSRFLAKYIPSLNYQQRKIEWQNIRKVYLTIIFPLITALLICLSLIFISLVFIFNYQNFNHPFLFICFIALLESLFSLSYIFLKSNSKYTLSTTLYSAKNFSFLILILIMWQLSSITLYSTIICYILCYIITLIYFLIYKKFFYQKHHNKQKELKNIQPINWKSYVFPYTLLSVTPYMFSALLMIIFEVFGINFEDQIGEFGALLALLNLALLAIFPLKTFTVNELAKHIEDHQKTTKNLTTIILFSLTTSVILFIVFTVISKLLIGLMAPIYHNLLDTYRLILVLVIFIGLNNPFSSYLAICHNANKIIASNIIIVLSYIFVIGGFCTYFFGLNGIIFTYFSSYFIYLGLNIFGVYKLHWLKKTIKINH